jgi:hypothetical protein
LFSIRTGVETEADDVICMDDAVIDIEKALTNALVNRATKVHASWRLFIKSYLVKLKLS